jgi:hypothetical protein
MRHLIQEGDSTPTQQRPLAVALQEEHTRVEAEVYAFDTLGVSLRGLTVWGNHRDAALEVLAQTISRQVTYLWEPLALIERDLEREEVQMRSAPPLVEDQAIEFYEGWLTRRDGAPRFHLVRYRRQNGEPRRTSVQFTLTHEVFRRLVDDLASILQAPEPE